MEYTAEELHEAFLADELARIQQENHSLFALSNDLKPSYPHDLLPDTFDPAVELTHDVVDGAKAGLTARFGGTFDAGDIGGALLSLSGGERDEQSLALAAAELAAMSPRQVTQLIADGEAALTVTAGHRRALAKEGQALGPGGDFPVHDLHHLRYAETQYKQGHLAGHPASVVKAHLRKAAQRLGVESRLDDDGDEDESSRQRRRKTPKTAQRGQRAANTDGSESFHAGGWGDAAGGPSGGDGASMTVVLAGSPIGDYLEMAARDNTPSAFGAGPMRFENLPEVHDVGSQPEDGDPTATRSAREIARVLKEHGGIGLFGGGGAAYGANRSITPKTAAARRAAQLREHQR